MLVERGERIPEKGGKFSRSFNKSVDER